MRSKALLVGAQAGFEGPWVNIEEGEWVVAPPSSVSLETNGATIFPGDLDFYVIHGPGKVKAKVSEEYEGEGVFLKMRQDQ
jgi:hypothetical protein